MKNNCKKVTLSHYETLCLLKIIEVKRSVAEEQENMDEATLMAVLTRRLLSGHLDDGNYMVTLDHAERFGLWLCADTYRDFLIYEKHLAEIPQIEAIMDKLK